MKQWSRRLVKNLSREASERVVESSKTIDRVGAVDQCTQKLLFLKYREWLHHKIPLPAFADVEFRSFSQNGEDGILLFLFAVLGATSRKAVEICAGNGIECNTANLVVNHGWTALMVDCDEESLAQGRRFYGRCPTTFSHPPTLVKSWVTTENVNDLITRNGFAGDIDLLSLDMDGVDYWIWKAIDSVTPRVVIVECNTLMGPDRSVTVPYRQDFTPTAPGHAGASLPAFVKLGREKGYRLVGCQAYGFNAVFLRNDVGTDLFPEVTPADCLTHPHALNCMEEGEKRLLGLEWVEV